MLSLVLYALFAASGSTNTGPEELRLLLDTVDTLQHPIEDFRCEYEGTSRFGGKVLDYTKTGKDGLYDTFSGVFVRRSGGDTRIEGLHRQEPAGSLTRSILLLRPAQNQAEEYSRPNDAPLGYSVVKSPKDVNTWVPGSYGQIFLIDKLKHDVRDQYLEPSLSDDQINGRPLKVLSIALKGLPNSLISRFWIDLKRTGHVVRREDYASGKVMSSRLDIKLAPFEVGETEVWMPVSGESVGYAAIDGGKPIVTKKPTSICKIHVVDGTMEFNKHPGPEVFTIKYKPGTPISDNLRKMTYEFGQQKIASRPSKAEAEKMLKDQLAEAEKQKSTLVVAETGDGTAWYTWLAWGFAGLVVVSLAALWVQRRAR